MSKKLTCWACQEVHSTAADLRNHYMRKPHRFLEVVCPWCAGRQLYRRPVDLRTHLQKAHPALKKSHGKDFPSDQDSFFLALKPRAYLQSTKVQVPGGPQATFLKEAVLGNGDLNPKEEWQRGWDRNCTTPTVPYSPTKPAMWDIEDIAISKEGGKVVVTGGGGETLRLTLQCGDQRARERLYRRMTAISSSQSLPESWVQRHNSVNTKQILGDIGLSGMEVSLVEVNAWEAETRHTPKRQKREETPLTPLASPSYSIELDAEELIQPPSREGPESTKPPTVDEVKEESIPLIPLSPTETAESTPAKDYAPSAAGDACLSPAESTPAKDYAPSAAGDACLSPAESTPAKDYAPSAAGDACSQTSQEPADALAVKARLLLLVGGMPLFPPARRDWSCGAEIALPLSDGMSQWPPKDWMNMDPDTRLLIWEVAATSLAIKFGMALDRASVQDAFQFLALPGSRSIEATGPEKDLRRGNFMALRRVLQKKKFPGDEALLEMLGQAFLVSESRKPGPYQDLLMAVEDIPLRI